MNDIPTFLEFRCKNETDCPQWWALNGFYPDDTLSYYIERCTNDNDCVTWNPCRTRFLAGQSLSNKSMAQKKFKKYVKKDPEQIWKLTECLSIRSRMGIIAGIIDGSCKILEKYIPTKKIDL